MSFGDETVQEGLLSARAQPHHSADVEEMIVDCCSYSEGWRPGPFARSVLSRPYQKKSTESEPFVRLLISASFAQCNNSILNVRENKY